MINVFADYRARTTNLEPRWLGGEVWGRFHDGELVAACHLGANLVMVEATDDDARVFAERALTRRRSVSTIYGLQAPVRAFWDVVGTGWGRPREPRWNQPHLEIDETPAVAADPSVRRTTGPTSTCSTRPAWRCTPRRSASRPTRAGEGPLPHPGEPADLARAGRSPASRTTAWSSRPRWPTPRRTPRRCRASGCRLTCRGQGLAAAGMAAVVEQVRRDVAPVVSLYVNGYNTPARATYARVGFRETATFATIMF